VYAAILDLGGDRAELIEALDMAKEKLDPQETKKQRLTQQMAQSLLKTWFDGSCFVYAHTSVS
jgi:hypothetical protein